jgi:DNA recombination protein RmuC
MSSTLLTILPLITLLLGLWLGYLYSRMASSASSEPLLLELNKKISEARERETESKTRAAELDQKLAELNARLNTALEDKGRLQAEATRVEEARKEAQEKSASEREQAARASALEAELKSERQSIAEKLALLEEAKTALTNQFQIVAGEILDQKSKTFIEGSQKEIGVLLDPLKTQIEDFRKKVEEAQSDSKTGVAALQGLIGGLSNLNQQLADEARNLSTALRGSAKAQGDWGEFILRDLLEKAGLREGEQYSFQQNFSATAAVDGDGAKASRTDVIVFLPGGRNLVVDSKVSLTAYTDYVSAANDEDRKTALKQHLASVRGHIAGLTRAGYDRLPGLETPDFIVMFVPVEPAFLLALQNDADLWAEAYHQGILLVGPTTLLYVIRIVNVLWHQDRQARNVKDVMDRGAKLYEKFAGFIADMEDIGSSLRSASRSYDDAWRKLSVGDGNLIRQVEKLRELGVKPRKPLPTKLIADAGIDEPALALAAQEAEEVPDSAA